MAIKCKGPGTMDIPLCIEVKRLEKITFQNPVTTVLKGKVYFFRKADFTLKVSPVLPLTERAGFS
jgi:hypothetical protein